MVPAAVDIIHLTKLEPPAPSAQTANGEAGAPSFQQHLQRAERRASEDVRSSRNERDERSERSNESASRPTSETAESRPPVKNESAEENEPPAVDDAAPKGEHDSEGETDKHDEPTETQIAAAAAVQVSAADANAAIEDEVLLTVSFEAAPIDEAAKGAAAKKAALAGDAATKEAAEATADAEAATVVKTEVSQSLEQVQPIGDEAGSKKPKPTEKPAEVKQADVLKIGESVEPNGANVVVVAEAAKTETSDDGNGKEREGDANAQGSEAPLDATAANQTTLVDAAATSPVATTVATSEASSGEDKKSTSNEPRDGGVSNADTSGDKTRVDRGHGNEPPRQAQQRDAAATRAEDGESTRSLSHADRARLVQRVARAVQTAQDRGGDLKIRLSPPELGSLRLQVRLTDGALSARIEADTPAARQLLVDNLPALRERLAEQNIRVERFDVDLFNSEGGASQTPQQQFNQDDAARSGTIRRATSRGAGETESSAAKTTTPTAVDGRLNVVV